MTKPRVLISDSMSSQAVTVFEEQGVEVVQSSKLSEAELFDMIGEFDGLAIRSSTRVSAELLEHAKNLKVVGRAGIGVDNVDVPACTRRGIVVMNTPLGSDGDDAGAGAAYTAGEQLYPCR
jgi:D-3-phosphoglycerate dehydrogenase